MMARCLAFTLLAVIGVGAAPAYPQRNSLPALAEEVDSVIAQLAKHQTAVESIDVDSIRTDYSQGKVFEQNRTLALRAIERLRLRLAQLKKPHPLVEAVAAVSSLEQLGRNEDGLISVLSSPPIALSDRDSETCLTWATRLQENQEQSEAAQNRLEDALSRAFAVADHKLAVCAGKS
jgi:hypothetical protein